jgi:hypothetical protein
MLTRYGNQWQNEAMNIHRVTKLSAAFFILAALAFTIQSFGNLGSGNIFFLVFNGVAAFYTGRIAFRQVKELRLTRV